MVYFPSSVETILSKKSDLHGFHKSGGSQNEKHYMRGREIVCTKREKEKKIYNNNYLNRFLNLFNG